ncbi:MAG: uridine kinase, partial [Akkermansiaceae bacterium]
HTLGSRSAMMTLDHFYHDLAHLDPAQRELVNFDHPDAIDWAAVEAAVSRLSASLPAEIPRYDFATHTRLKETERLDAAPLVILEGLWPLTRPALQDASSLSIFIECPADLRLARRIARDTVERGRSEESVRRQFLDHVAPMHELHVQSQASIADLIFPHDFGKAEIASLLNHPLLTNS